MSGLPKALAQYVMPEPNSGCWIWLGGVDQDNYGKAWDGAKKRTVRAPRLFYQLLVGKIPKGVCVLHRCDNPPCVNPDHLFLGTKGDNNRDRHQKGRSASGTRHGMNKISAETAATIKSAGGTQRDIAAEFGVSHALVWMIKSGRLWKSLEQERAS